MFIKLESTIITHPKLLKLSSRLKICDTYALGHLCRLWNWTMNYAPDGNLESYDNEDICIGAGWNGDSNEFIKNMILIGFLDKSKNDKLSIHDWLEHNDRLKRAESTRKYRENKKLNNENDTPCDHVTSRDITAKNRDEERRREERIGEENIRKEKEKENLMCSSSNEPHGVIDSNKQKIIEIFDHYRTLHSKAHPKPLSNSKEYRAITARLKEGYSVEDLKQAIDGCHKSKFHQGDNDKGKRYDSLELIVRDGSKVNQFLEIARNGESPPVLSDKTQGGKYGCHPGPKEHDPEGTVDMRAFLDKIYLEEQQELQNRKKKEA